MKKQAEEPPSKAEGSQAEAAEVEDRQIKDVSAQQDSAGKETSKAERAGQALVWVQTVLCVLSVAAGIVIGLVGPLALGIAGAGAGAALVGGVQITVHIRR